MPQALKQIQNYLEELEHPWNESIEHTFDKTYKAQEMSHPGLTSSNNQKRVPFLLSLNFAH